MTTAILKRVLYEDTSRRANLEKRLNWSDASIIQEMLKTAGKPPEARKKHSRSFP